MRPRLPSLIAFVVAASACIDATKVPTGVDSAPLAVSSAIDGTRGYAATLLPTLPGAGWSAAFAINTEGVAVGFSNFLYRVDLPDWYPEECSLYMAATIFDHGSVRSLHRELVVAIGGNPCYTGSIATGINDRGEVVGTVWRSNEDETERGFFWSEATGVILYPEPGLTYLTGINSTGLVVGNCRYDYRGWYDFLWSPLGSPPPVIRPRHGKIISLGVNDAGRRAACADFHPFTIDLDGTFRHLGEDCSDPASLLKLDYYVQNIGGGINAEGTMVFTDRGAPRRWDAASTRSTAVGWQQGAAAGISDPGRIVGWRTATSEPKSVAMTVGPRGQPVVLPSPSGLTATEAYAVNACGDIAGAAFVPNPSYPGHYIAHAVIWSRSICDKP